MEQRILMICAHPDDELLWMGGTLLKYRENFKVDFACLTMPFNRSRVKGLFRIERHFNTGVILCFGYEDDTAVWREGVNFDFDDQWLDCLDYEKYDLIFSHNRYGEYYHPHHIYIHNRLKEKGIPFISFGHLEFSDFYVNLDDKERSEKQNLLMELYPSEYERSFHKFTYWHTNIERFRFEIPDENNEKNENEDVREEFMKKIDCLWGGELQLKNEL
ncbi:MAG: PIG-L family deacetylase [Candidatus Eremiobacteraeota bacterium]|nr:PIG-L family deacetylase [Candidatus Eremiobacteraeota bacterium]